MKTSTRTASALLAAGIALALGNATAAELKIQPDGIAIKPQNRAAAYDLRISRPDGEVIQHAVFEVGKRHPFESLRLWFQALYETLLGSSQGPRMGSFIALYGIDNSRKLIEEAIRAAEQKTAGA